MSPATINTNSTLPAAFASSHSASRPSGSITSWIQRGTTARGGSTGGVRRSDSSPRARSSSVGGASSGVFSGTSVTCLPPSAKYG